MRTHHTGLAVIAVFKLVKGVLLLLVGLGLLKLMHGYCDALLPFDRSAPFECRFSDYSCAGSESGCLAAA